MSRWFRHYAGMCRDDKLVRVALRSKQTIERVVWVYSAILESAAEIDDGGRFEIDAPEIAYFLRCDEGDVEAVMASLADMGRLDGGCVARWKDRQFQSDRSAERTRRYRDRNKTEDHDAIQSRRLDVTSQKRSGDSPETETETETETKAEKKEVEARSANAAPEKPSASKKGTRLDPAWIPTPEDHSIAVALLGRQRADGEVAKFRDYWVAKPGKDGCKLDWDATWRNWIRRASESPAPRFGSTQTVVGIKPHVRESLVWVEEGSEGWAAWKRAKPGYVNSQLQERSENGKTLVGAYLPSAQPVKQEGQAA